jgi:hypothetical protein
VLLCPAQQACHASLRADMWNDLVKHVGAAAVATVKAKPTADCLEAILGGHDWNGSRTGVQEVVGKHLARLLASRATMLGLGTRATGSGMQVAPPAAGSRAKVPAVEIAFDRVAERDTACQCCQLKFSKRHND